MELYLLRHAIAADRGAGGVMRDADRPLTEEGREKMRAEAAGMRALGLKFDYIFTSPYLRTRQTTEVVVEAYETPADRVIELDVLAAGRPFEQGLSRRADLFAEIGTWDFDRALIVGHQPDLSEMVSVLLAGEGGVYVEFKKGALCALVVSELPPRRPAVLLWALAPRQLRLLGRG